MAQHDARDDGDTAATERKKSEARPVPSAFENTVFTILMDATKESAQKRKHSANYTQGDPVSTTSRRASGASVRSLSLSRDRQNGNSHSSSGGASGTGSNSGLGNGRRKRRRPSKHARGR